MPGYDKLLRDAVTSDYAGCSQDEVDEVDAEAAAIATGLEIADRVESFSNAEAFATLKDHKQGFPGRVDVRLLNPAKSQLGRIAKVKLQGINATIKRKTGLQQWRKTRDTIRWFEELEGKGSCKFFKFDFQAFYPSIKKSLFVEAIEWSRNYIDVSGDTFELLLHVSKSFLFTKGKTFKKKPDGNNNDTNFDITMGAYHGAEACELVGLYLLQQLVDKGYFPKGPVGLYRNDGLAVVQLSGKGAEDLSKEISKLFKAMGLKLTYEVNNTTTDFLDVKMDLKSGEYKPFMKPNDHPLYISKQSNHPPHIFKNLPAGICNRISTNSSSEEIFKNAEAPYLEALRTSKFSENEISEGWKYEAKDSINEVMSNYLKAKKARKTRNKVFFTPPYNAAIATNIIGFVIKLVAKCFTKEKAPTLSKAFNCHSVCCTYRTGRNIKAYIDSHNKGLLRREAAPATRPCNCRGHPCPVDGECWSENVVYEAEVRAAEVVNGAEVEVEVNGWDYRTYQGQALKFKQRWYGQNGTFTNPTKILTRKSKDSKEVKVPIEQQIAEKEEKSELAKYIWKVKKKGLKPIVKWKILLKARPYSKGSSYCDLCLSEKTIIAIADKRSLNKRNEILRKCTHMVPFKLSSIPFDPT